MNMVEVPLVTWVLVVGSGKVFCRTKFPCLTIYFFHLYFPSQCLAVLPLHKPRIVPPPALSMKVSSAGGRATFMLSNQTFMMFLNSATDQGSGWLVWRVQKSYKTSWVRIDIVLPMSLHADCLT